MQVLEEGRDRGGEHGTGYAHEGRHFDDVHGPHEPGIGVQSRVVKRWTETLGQVLGGVRGGIDTESTAADCWARGYSSGKFSV